jgi:hypothetical protein
VALVSTIKYKGAGKGAQTAMSVGAVLPVSTFVMNVFPGIVTEENVTEPLPRTVLTFVPGRVFGWVAIRISSSDIVST